ncbi:MAG: nickel pincer cofactor biosynthesis protein LarC [Lachnospiraceae bacterium]|nr:nickel pincer cofactor biosynthesis protein LarC [Lachnospiraceae bacterium]
MKTLYLDCGMGAAGDMLTAALLELLPDPDGFIEELNAIGIPEVTIEKERVSKCGIGGTHIAVKIHGVEEGEAAQGEHHDESVPAHHHDMAAGHGHTHHHDMAAEHEHTHHHHSGMKDIEHIVRHLSVPERVRKDIIAVYTLIAEAESHAHGVPVPEIHFHEVGTMDAVTDVTAVCLLMDRIAPDQVVASPVHVGSGQVKCAHGILPVPAPATAYILRDVPIYGGGIRGELCTPTGAALLKYFVTEFGDMPVMKTTAIGYGMGKKDFPAANCVRAMLGETEGGRDIILELNCNVDDMTGESIGFAMEALFADGALEVYTVPVGMKKSRPGTLFCVMCRPEDKEKMVKLLFRHTTTIGIRERRYRRYTLDRSVETVRTPYGDIRSKISTGYGVTRQKYEYEDLAKAARENDLSVSQILDRL